MLRYFISIASFFLCALFGISAFAQGEIDDQQTVLFKNERTYGLSVHSNGYGFNYRYGKRINGIKQVLYDVDFVEIKHPKEYKTSNPYSTSTSRFVYGKVHNLYSLRVGVGLQKEIYSKFDKGSVAIRYFYSLGGSMGILKPVYYLVWYQAINGSEIESFEQYSSSSHRTGSIIGKASYFSHIKETTVTPGGFAKFGYSFEYSKHEMLVRALEVGAIAEAFYLRAPLMGIEYTKPLSRFLAPINDRVFITLFLCYRFGKIVEKR